MAELKIQILVERDKYATNPKNEYKCYPRKYVEEFATCTNIGVIQSRTPTQTITKVKRMMGKFTIPKDKYEFVIKE